MDNTEKKRRLLEAENEFLILERSKYQRKLCHILENRLGEIGKKLSCYLQKLCRKEKNIQLMSSEGTNVEPQTETFQTKAASLHELKVAAIMDEFSLNCFRPECNLLEISPDNFKEEMDMFQPDLLLVESAGKGNHGLWEKKIAYGSREYFALVRYCYDKNIPVVFWNKEDPVHYEEFLIVAKTADYVFTTDVDSILNYCKDLGHDRVYHMHFAAQPQIHNPIEKYDRQDKICFAGAYYRGFKKRAEAFDKFAEAFIATKGLDIYDREYGKKRSPYRFPSKYKPYILGRLRPEEIDKAYKGYNYGLNMNTVTDSVSMFARRVFELMASNTVSIGNYAKGLENYFQELTICTDDVEDMKQKLQKYCGDEASLHKYRLLGLRKILSEHLYEDRLNYIVETVFQIRLKKELPVVTVISRARTAKECQWIIKEFREQVYERKKLILFYDDRIITENNLEGDVRKQAIDRAISEMVSEGYVAYFHPDDYYAPAYLYDMIYTLRYCEADVIGKCTYYRMENEQLHKNGEKVYQYFDAVASRRAIQRIELVKEMTFDTYIQKDVVCEASVFCIDEWNYCENTNGCKNENIIDRYPLAL